MSGMNGFQAMQPLTKLRGKALVCLCRVTEQRVTAAYRTLEQVQERCPYRLLFIGHI
jgi:hypothetical protein